MVDIIILILSKIIKKKLRTTGICEGNPQVSGGFPSQWANNAKKVNFSFDDVIMFHDDI